MAGLDMLFDRSAAAGRLKKERMIYVDDAMMAWASIAMQFAGPGKWR